MLVAILTVIALFIFVQVISFISWRDMKRRRKSYIRGKFGAVPKAREWNENRRNFCDLYPEEIGVDDITWNDLSMNQVFDRINQCDTSAGEEILYWRLRKNAMDEEERALFEKRVEAFDRDERLRESVEDLLCDMGKSSASYYIPSYMDSIERYFIHDEDGKRIGMDVVEFCQDAVDQGAVARRDADGKSDESD